MGFRFRRTLRVLPGVRLNVSKSGVSTSIGGRGAWFTFGRRGVRTTAGIPGTGLSYTTSSSSRRHAEPGERVSQGEPMPTILRYLLMAFLSVVAIGLLVAGIVVGMR